MTTTEKIKLEYLKEYKLGHAGSMSATYLGSQYNNDYHVFAYNGGGIIKKCMSKKEETYLDKDKVCSKGEWNCEDFISYSPNKRDREEYSRLLKMLQEKNKK